MKNSLRLVLILGICVSIFVYSLYQNQGYINIKNNNIEIYNANRLMKAYCNENNLVFNNINGKKAYIFSSPVVYYENNKLTIYQNNIKQNHNSIIYKNGKYEAVFYKYKTRFQIIKDFRINITTNNKKITSKIKQVKNELTDNYQNAILYETKNKKVKYNISPNIDGVSIDYNCSGEINKNLKFYMNISDSQFISYVVSEAGYINIVDRSKSLIGILQKPIIKYKNKLYFNDASFNLKCSKNNLEFNVNAKNFLNKQYQVIFAFSFYENKQPDSQVTSACVNMNQYLNDFVYIGKNKMNENKYYFKFDLSDIFEQNIKIKSAYYYFYNFSNKSMTLDVYQLKKEWKSSKICWNSKIQELNFLVSRNTVKKRSICKIDITTAVQLWNKDKTNQFMKNGLVLKSQNNYICAFSSADSIYFNNYIEINFYNA